MQQFKDWYWIVGRSTTQVYSSLRNVYVPISDADYRTWLAVNGGAPNIASEADIWYYVGDLLPPWLFDGTTFAQPAIGAYTAKQLKGYAANARYNKEVGGTTVSGVPYPTDRETQSKMAAAVLLAQVSPSSAFKWKLANGSFSATLDASGMITVASAVGAFVNSCFTAEQTVDAAIDAGTITTAAQVDAAFA